MPPTQIETFPAEHLAGAAAVLSARHADHLAQSPLLAPGDARAALKDFWDKKGRSGAVAIQGGRVVGFVLAEIKAHPLLGARRGRRDDRENAGGIDREFSRIQQRSPSFSRLPLNRGARRDEWIEMDLDEDGLRYLVAELAGKAGGHSLTFR